MDNVFRTMTCCANCSRMRFNSSKAFCSISGNHIRSILLEGKECHKYDWDSKDISERIKNNKYYLEDFAN